MVFQENLKKNIRSLVGIISKRCVTVQEFRSKNIICNNVPMNHDIRKFLYKPIMSSDRLIKPREQYFLINEGGDLDYLCIIMERKIKGIINIREDYIERTETIIHEIGTFDNELLEIYLNVKFHDDFKIKKIQFTHRLKIRKNASMRCRKCELLGNTFWIDDTVNDLKHYTLRDKYINSTNIKDNINIPYYHWNIKNNLIHRKGKDYNTWNNYIR